MKKFLSLAMALVMTLSLVTIGAGAVEYKDLTDKDEIKYEEAVAVLNRIGVISGYEDGSFKPETELTRGAAAKIIVSLLIGPDAAANLEKTFNPYPDVPAGHEFAGVISYCKTANIISGYPDGTFRPAGTLTGYAFSKMLLGALGYDSAQERFTGDGWMMNVNRLGGEAGLFDHISFRGNEAVDRQTACQLALNTLKATMVEYGAGMNINVSGSGADVNVTSDRERSYKTSNQEYASHINNRKANGDVPTSGNALYTVEFGEEHFVDLRMSAEGTTLDKFGRPSNEWSYKKVTIGTYPQEADFEFTTQVIHNVSTTTDAAKRRALGMANYEAHADGAPAYNTAAGANNSRWTAVYVNGRFDGYLDDVADIADYTDNGTLVQAYLDLDDADWIRYVSVIQTQLMEIKSVASSYVALGKYDGDGSDNVWGSEKYGFNKGSIEAVVANVEEDDDCFEVLKDKKVGDIVAVVPVAEDYDSSKYTVDRVYVPETVSGQLTKAETYGSSTASASTIAVTVGGSVYKVAPWNFDLYDIDSNAVKVTSKDVTLYLDEYGNAMLAKDVGSTSDYMVVTNYYQNVVSGRICTFAEGYDIAGEKVSLNLGANPVGISSIKPGDLVKYTNDGTSNSADWKIYEDNDHGIFSVKHYDSIGTRNIDLKASDQKIKLDGFSVSGDDAPYYAKNVKFIFVSFDSDGEVDSVEFLTGAQKVSNSELRSYYDISASPAGIAQVAQGSGGGYDDSDVGYNTAQACIDLKDGAQSLEKGVKAVVIKNDSSSVTTSNILYVRDTTGYIQRMADGTVVYGYKVAIAGSDGLISEDTVVYSDRDLKIGEFARWTKATKDGFEDNDNYYELRKINITNMTTSAIKSYVTGGTKIYGANNSIIELGGGSNPTYTDWSDPVKHPADDGVAADCVGISQTSNTWAPNSINTRNAIWIDETNNAIRSANDIKNLMKSRDDGGKGLHDVQLSFVFNDNDDSDNFRSVAMIVVTNAPEGGSGSGSSSGEGGVSATIRLGTAGYPVVDFAVVKPDWAASDATGTLDADIRIDGVSGADSANTTITGSGTVSAMGSQYCQPGTDISLGDVTVEWDKVKATTTGDVPTGASIATASTSLSDGETTVVITMTGSTYTGGKVKIMQGETVLKASGNLDTIPGDNSITLDVGVDIDREAAVTVQFFDMVEAPVNKELKVSSSGAWSTSSIDRTENSGTEVSFDISSATPFATKANTTDVTAAISFTSAAGKTNPTVKSAVIKVQGVEAKDATYAKYDAASVDYNDPSNTWATIEAAAGNGTTSGSGKVYTKNGDGTYSQVMSAPTGDHTTTEYYQMTADAVAAVNPVITVKFDMPREDVEITAVVVKNEMLAP